MSGKKKAQSPIKDPLVEDEDQSGDAAEELGDVDNSSAEETSDSGDSEPPEETEDDGTGDNAPEPAPVVIPRNKSRPVN